MNFYTIYNDNSISIAGDFIEINRQAISKLIQLHGLHRSFYWYAHTFFGDSIAGQHHFLAFGSGPSMRTHRSYNKRGGISLLYFLNNGFQYYLNIIDSPTTGSNGNFPVSYTHLTLPTKRIV